MASSTSLPSGANHFISLGKAIQMTSKCRSEKENVLTPDLRNQKIIFTCETFNRDAFDKLLAQQGCAGIRIYTGMNDQMQLRAIVVGVNESNEDMLPDQAGASDTDGNSIVEEGQLCPDLCPPSSPLNS